MHILKFVEGLSKSKFLPRQWRLGRRLSPFLVALGHKSAHAVKATAGGWSTGSFACLTFPLHSLMSSARREGSEYHFLSLWYDSGGVRAHDLPVVRQTLYHWAITPVLQLRYIRNQIFLKLCFATSINSCHMTKRFIQYFILKHFVQHEVGQMERVVWPLH